MPRTCCVLVLLLASLANASEELQSTNTRKWADWITAPLSRALRSTNAFLSSDALQDPSHRDDAFLNASQEQRNQSTTVEAPPSLENETEHVKEISNVAVPSSGEHESLSLPVGMPDVRGGKKPKTERSARTNQTSNKTNVAHKKTTEKPKWHPPSTKRPWWKPSSTRTMTSTSTATTTVQVTTQPAADEPQPRERHVKKPSPPPPPGFSKPQDFRKVELDEDTWDLTTSPYRSQEDLNRLWDHLFKDYRKQIPPIPLDGGPLAVGVGINFVKIKDLDEVQGAMNVALALRLCWDDARLAFDAIDYFNKSWTHEGDKLPLLPEMIWTPDIVVLNVVGSVNSLLDSHSSPLVLADELFRRKTGVNVLWSRPLDVQANCKVDMTQYPFDEQVCYIHVGSWTSSRREMSLIAQPFFAEHTIHSSEFKVENISVEKHEVYTHGAAQTFNEVIYKIVLRRYPHYHFINFILPMLSVTLLTVATMWMSNSQVGARVNSATKLLLCVVSIMFITARSRPALHGDIWIDRFQSHCLAISMSAVLESLFIDHISKSHMYFNWMPKAESIDPVCRSLICFMTSYIVYKDVKEIKRRDFSLNDSSTGLLILFVYLLAFALAFSSVTSLIWALLPRFLRRKMLGRDDAVVSTEEEEQPLLFCVEDKAGVKRTENRPVIPPQPD